MVPILAATTAASTISQVGSGAASALQSLSGPSVSAPDFLSFLSGQTGDKAASQSAGASALTQSAQSSGGAKPAHGKGHHAVNVVA